MQQTDKLKRPGFGRSSSPPLLPLGVRHVALINESSRPPARQPVKRSLTVTDSRWVTINRQGSAAEAGWYADPGQPLARRWWDGTSWTEHLQPAPPSQVLQPSAPPRNDGSELEQKVAALIASLGYSVRTNVMLEGRSGARHEIDVLGEKADALSSFTVAVECKAWEQPIEKDVVAKFSYVLNDLGLREGIIVALGGARTGATKAAAELGIALWGPDELRDRLGAVAVSDLTTPAPRHTASGLAVQLDGAQARSLIEREASGKLGFGAEAIAWTSLVWLPIAIVQIALSRTEGRIKKVTQTRRIWNAYDQVTGLHTASWQTPPPTQGVDISSGSLRPKQRESACTRELNDTIRKYQSVSTEAAKARHANTLAALGVPTGYAAVPESTVAAFMPLFLAIAHRKGAERVIAVDTHHGHLHPRLGKTLSQNIHWLRESLA